MAGHSKFKNIQFRKGAQDKKRSKIFSKLSRDITLAAKQGLPDLNIGTAAGASCAAARQARIEAALSAQQAYDWVVNGRFKGGYITRHYGDPANGIDAVQLEISQRIYMDEDSFAYDDALSASAARAIRALIEAALRADTDA